MNQPLQITFNVPAPLVPKVRAALRGIYTADMLGERVFLAWLNGVEFSRLSRPASSRLSIVTRWREARAKSTAAGQKVGKADERFRKQLEREGIVLSRGSLFVWGRRYDRGGVKALEDQWASQPKDYAADPFMQEIRRLMESGRLSLAECHRSSLVMAKQQGWETRSYTTVARYLRSLLKSEKRSVGWPAMGLRAAFKRA